MNNGNACFYLSGMHISGILKDEYNTAKAKQELEQKDKPSSKGQVSSLPAAAYVVERDMQKAFEFAYKACELRNMYACANLSQMYAKGDGIAKDEKKAEKYKQLAMEMQDEIKKQQQPLNFQQGLNPS